MPFIICTIASCPKILKIILNSLTFVINFSILNYVESSMGRGGNDYVYGYELGRKTLYTCPMWWNSYHLRYCLPFAEAQNKTLKKEADFTPSSLFHSVIILHFRFNSSSLRGCFLNFYLQSCKNKNPLIMFLLNIIRRLLFLYMA
jgi:hypothetical protein